MSRAPGHTCAALEEARATHLKFSVDLLPEVNVPWVCPREGLTISAIQRSFHDTIDDLLRLETAHPRMPPIYHVNAQWTVLRDFVVVRDCFATADRRGPEVEAVGHTIRVPIPRMLAILARISSLLGDLARRQGAEVAEPAGGKAGAQTPHPTYPAV